MTTAEEFAALRAEIAELRGQLEAVRAAFHFHEGQPVELRVRQARVQYLTFGPPGDSDATYGFIHTHENGSLFTLANGEDASAFSVATGRRADKDGVKMRLRDDGTELLLRPGHVAADTYVDAGDRRAIKAEAFFGIQKGMATMALFGPGAEPLVLLRALPEGGVVRCVSAADKAEVLLHVRAQSPMLTLHDGEGRPIVKATATNTGGAVVIHGGEARKPCVMLGAAEEGAFAEWRTFDDEPRVTIQGGPKSSGVFIRRPGKAQEGLFLRAEAEGSTLDLVQEGKRLVHFGYQWVGVDLVLAPALGGQKISSGPMTYGGALFLSTTDNRMLAFNPVDVKAQIASTSPEGLAQFQLGAPFDAGGRLILYNEIGVERLTFQTDKDGGLIQLLHGGTLAASLAATPQGGVLCTLDPEGVVTATLPADFDMGSPGEG